MVKDPDVAAHASWIAVAEGAINSGRRAGYAPSVDDELEWIASAAGASRARRGERIQSLWGGYGELLRVALTGADRETVIVKSVKPPAAEPGDRSHARKCRSYEVEARWYREFGARCDDTCRVPTLLGARASREGGWCFVLEDLDRAGFPGRRGRPAPGEIEACLGWLASFHARFLGVKPEGLWSTGTYWHLATRPDELSAIDDPDLRAAAPVLDRLLRDARFQTIVHGDAKVANFCFAEDGSAVAAVDFQYVGGGPGVKDLAYFLGSVSRRGAEANDPRYLDAYFVALRAALGRAGVLDIEALETEWRRLYPIACADFYRFFAGWAKDHYRRDEVGRRIVGEVLRTLAI